MSKVLYDFIWNEKFWFPPNRTYGWKDLQNEPGSSIYLPDLKHLNWTIGLGVVLIGVRYLIETFLFVPFGLWLGVPCKNGAHVRPNQQLEREYKKKSYSNKHVIKNLSKQTDMTEMQVERWFRKRKKMDAPSPMQKFRECCWHCLCYSLFFTYGLVYLWQKPYFWKTVQCWKGWPKQDVTSDMYWHYMLELGFYWGLVFTLFTDTKRKDFKELIVHHFATITLMYFSWVLNFVRIGTLVLLLHDAADPWLALAKMSGYVNNKLRIIDIFFAIFFVVWILSRLTYFPFVVIYSTAIETYGIIMDTTFGAHWFFNFFLLLLFVLHLIWSYMIFRILYRKIVRGNVEDVRSDTENSDDEIEEEADTINHLANGIKNGVTSNENSQNHKP